MLGFRTAVRPVVSLLCRDGGRLADGRVFFQVLES